MRGIFRRNSQIGDDPKLNSSLVKGLEKSDSACQMQCNSSVTRKAGEILVASFQPELEIKSKTKPNTKTKILEADSKTKPD